jgi:NADH-quinone oxidoreductase subunit C
VDTTSATDAAEPVAPPEAEVERVHGVAITRSGDQLVAHPTRDQLLDLVGALRADGFWQCVDLCGVDYLTHPNRPPVPDEVATERFEVVVFLVNHQERSRLRLRVQIPEDDPTCPSLLELHPSVHAPEREVFDMFGITFDGHPDMTRILMPEDWEGHPLRKDYSIGKIPVQFKATSSDQEHASGKGAR